MLKQQQSSSLHKPDFFPIPKLTPLLQSYDIPAPVILYSRSDPYPFLNPDPLVDQSLLRCNDIPEPVSHHSRSDLCQVLDSNLHVDQGLDPVSAMDIDLWIASRSEIEVVARITDLTAFEHAGGTLGEPTTIVSTTSSDFSRNSKVGAPQTVKDVVVTKVESENTHSIRCDVCNVICNSQKAFKRHMEGKTHLKNTQKLPVTSPIKQETPSPVVNKILDQDFDKKNEIYVDSLFYCSIPELGCANQEFQNIVTEQVIEPMCLDGFKPSNGWTHNGHEKLYVHQPMWCDVCKVGCSSNKCFKRHISGKQHLKNVKVSEKKAAAILPSTVIKGEVVNLFESNSTRCELCGISCTSHDGLNSHISGKKHQKNLKKSENLFGNRPANEVKQTLQDPMIEKGEIVEESNKRKADISLSSDDVDTKRQKMMEEEVGGSGVLLTCKVCSVGCTGITAYNFHLASFEHSAMVLKQVKCG